MATKKDLVEAYSFSRRRLVTAFVSGAPGGREVEPSRPGRALIGGIALTVLVLAAAAVIGFLKPRPDAGWADSEGLILAEGDAQLYLVQVGQEGADTVLVPVVNTVSARLILGSQLDPVTVPQDEIDDYQVVEGVGIVGAPVSTPSSSSLVGTGWTSCTAPGAGVRTLVAPEPLVSEVVDRAVFVSVGAEYFLVAPGQPDPRTGVPRYFRMQLPSDPTVLNNLLSPLRGPAVEDGFADVPRAWVDMFPAGPALGLESFALEGTETGPASQGLTDEAGTPVPAGTLVALDGEDAIATTDGYWPLTPFASAVYAGLRGTTPLEVSGSPGRRLGDAYPADTWPTDVPEELESGSRTDVCAVLHTQDDAPPVVTIGVRPADEASADGLGVDQREARVELGSGAVVRSGGFTSTDADDAFLIDSQAIRYALPGDSLQRLGYTVGQAPVVPASWVEMFNPGVTLTRDEALRTLSASRQEPAASEGSEGAG